MANAYGDPDRPAMNSETRSGQVFKVCRHDRYADVRDVRRHDSNTYAVDHVFFTETRAFMALIQGLERS